MKTFATLLLVIFNTICISVAAQGEPKYGVIKVRKPEPVEFFVEIDYVPEYTKGDLYDDLYKNLDHLEDQNTTIWMNVIMDERGQVIWAEQRDKQSNAVIRAIVHALKELKIFTPHEEQGLNVPAQFLIPVKV